MKTSLIVALDYPSEAEAFSLIEYINPNLCALKVGSEMFTLLGPHFIKRLVAEGYKVFLDLKFHDIPNTVAKACQSAAELGVWMINVHASGGLKMMQAAKSSVDLYGKNKPLIIAVTILTSMDSSELPSIGLENKLENQVSRLANLARLAGLDGVVCSAHEVPFIKEQCGADFLTITPGIRLSGDGLDDQSRVVTPLEAITLGSDYLVVGRSITRASSPAEAINKILQLIYK